MTTVYLVRHAEAEGNLYQRFHGVTDGKLTENGIRQAEKLAGFLAEKTELDRIYSSDLSRALSTARAISKGGQIPVAPLKELREIDGGEWENLTFAEIEARFPVSNGNFSKNPAACVIEGGESIAQLRERIVTAFTKIAGANTGRRIAIVSHGCAIRVLIGYLKKLPLAELGRVGWVDNASLSKILVDDDGEAHLCYEGKNDYLKGISTFETQDWWKEQ